MLNWWILIKERFSPASYVPMIFLFTGANGLFFASAQGQPWNWGRFVLVFLLLLSFFFRMRLFDEIKDYEVDVKVNPTRPLARGILTVSQVKVALLVLIVFEVVLASSLGLFCLLIHAAAMGYSLLMYEEFFVGDVLRPHLTTYAVTHTFVSVLLGLSSGVAMTNMNPQELSPKLLLFVFMNWAFFNLFEFARKTFASAEERPHVPSYSNIFSDKGAWALSLSQAILGVGVVYYLLPHWIWPASLTAYIVLSSVYIIKKTTPAAQFFRAISGVYLLFHYALVIYMWRS
ncbi:MAG: manganese transporter permease [Bdellovibrio sp. ArHS]|uniref:UbiA family prenyltransferase n=1 Tax=Bdellovibrio sp. ArHS TaxID=1569284 RepID=UPI0005837C89|nr:UbiA family prenyltransferase [Bdellovibrio sp. ArHS]KHD87766.1 MAG: manganese transporter permease [Bdellovibrio sp. ArHS]